MPRHLPSGYKKGSPVRLAGIASPPRGHLLQCSRQGGSTGGRPVLSLAYCVGDDRYPHFDNLLALSPDGAFVNRPYFVQVGQAALSRPDRWLGMLSACGASTVSPACPARPHYDALATAGYSGHCLLR